MSFYKPVTKEELSKVRGYNPLQMTLKEIHDSSWDVVEIDWKGMGYRTCDSVSSCFRIAVTRGKYPLHVFIRGGRLFIKKTIPTNK